VEQEKGVEKDEGKIRKTRIMMTRRG